MSGAGILLRSVPEALIAGVNSGDYQVYGSVIRSLTSGRIVGHLQETDALTRVTGHLVRGPLSAPGAALDLLGQGVSIAQNEQIKAAIASMQSLQIGMTALQVASIGISVAGFAVLSRRIDALAGKMDAVLAGLDRIGASIELLREERIRADLADLRTLAERYNEAWLLSDPTPQWHSVDAGAHRLASQFRERIHGLLDGPGTPINELEPFLAAWQLATDLRISSRLAAGEEAAARSAARDIQIELDGISDTLSPSEIAVHRTGIENAASSRWARALDEHVDGLRPFFDRLEARQIATDTRMLTLTELETQKISGRAWLEAARLTEDQPLIFLNAQPATA